MSSALPFRALLYTQWKWCRLITVFGTIAGFALPLVSLQGAARGSSALGAQDLLRTVQSWGTLYPLLAAALGLFVAVATWAPDHRGRHVHALTLPLPRWHYVLLRFGAGVVLLIPPIIAVMLAAQLAVHTASLPPGIQGYPLSLAVRFALAALVAYGVFFAVSAGTARTAGIILGLIAAVILVQVLVSIANIDLDLLGMLEVLLLRGAGPLGVFTGRWMLVDV